MFREARLTALITGAGKGIGKAIALELSRQGVFVYINYVSDEISASKTLAEIQAENGDGMIVGFDVTDCDRTGAAIKEMVEACGHIDILVNNAGIREDRLLAMMKEDAWRRVINANLNSFYNVTKPVVKQMLKNRFGRIVNIVSTSGQMGNAGQVNYSASKAGLIGATKALAREVASRNITVNAVSPGFIETRMLDGMDREQITRTIPANRLGTPEDVAYVTAFLCSSRAAYVTGQVIGVNGGLI